MRTIIIVFIKKRCLHFENLNVHLVSHRILISGALNYVIYFVSCKVFIDRLTIYCMQTDMLALQDK